MKQKGINSGTSKRWLFIHCIQIKLEFKNVGFRGGENQSTQIQNSRSKDETIQQTQPIYDAKSGNQTRATWLGNVFSPLHHPCALSRDGQFIW